MKPSKEMNSTLWSKIFSPLQDLRARIQDSSPPPYGCPLPLKTHPLAITLAPWLGCEHGGNEH
jgi:hypothetical protein